MKKVILFDAFSFVGYGLCRQMIDEEIHVMAVDELPIQNSANEDKMLQIGRNAYFEFIEYPKILANQRMFEHVDAVIYPWVDTSYSERKNEKKLHSVVNFCNEAKSKLILVSTNRVKGKENIDLNIEFEDDWYSKINFENSLCEHRKIRTNNIEFLFTFIDFSSVGLEKGNQKKNEHKEWIFQNFLTNK